ncbi:AMP-binding protein [Pseudoalteromonas rubra]|uniref:Non-ribosomal peptide synthetase n=1 Tax=Pseudoalteromonas rubra TaxID=43658 RepID=A0A0F4QXZ6_9GAMM|nr:AMP-binding protein [Pseudoalteromonas rubra]KJZ11452.1 hypothetical protein TW77_06150 [Pseudoalteromonas rubra]
MNDLTTKQRALSAFKSRVISQLGCDELVHEQLQIATDSVLNPDTLKYHIGGLFHLQGDFCPQDLIKQITLVFNHLCGESELDLDMTQALADKAQARTFAEQFKQRPFELEHGALVRIALRPALQGGYFVVLIAHHILLDGLSLYRLFCKALAMLPLSVKEITTELAQMRYHNTHKHTARHLAFWQTYLQDLPDFMFDYIPPAQAGTQTLSAHFSVPSTQIQALHSLCQQHNVGFHVYIAHLLGKFYQHHFNQSVVVGYALNNQRRNQHNYGMSSKVLPQIVKPAGQTFIESIKTLQWDFNQLFRKSQVPIGEINQCAAVSASARTLVYDVMINYLNPGALMDIDGVDLGSEMLVQSDHSHPISVNLVHNEHSNMEVMLSANPTFIAPTHLQQLATLLENALHLGAQQTLQFNATKNGAVEETPTTPQWQFNVATIESVVDAPVSAPEQEQSHGVCLDSLAYLVFSSGTTGVPKGIMLAQRTLANLCLHHRLDPNLSAPTQVLNTTALGFDVAIQTLLTTLCCGGTLHLTTSNVRKEAANILDNVASNHISRLIVTPSLLHILAAQASFSTHTFDTLEQVIVSGEQMVMSEQVRAFLNRSGATLINQYGPAETHVVTQHSLHDLADPFAMSGWRYNKMRS